ncbi:hypothetical protein F2Q69_00052972 [Brassica cretica]|uniref:Uncharacterized protein n=1 Tax=Brassica cretica TaxID=69181 RepID=A0A8S9N0T2_BRACR|nr:hypothetical protein F2Q69_00052972 [Brassica cretica]
MDRRSIRLSRRPQCPGLWSDRFDVHSYPSRDPRPSAGSADVFDQTNGSVALNGWNNQRVRIAKGPGQTYGSSKRSIVSQGPISCKAVRMGLGRTQSYGSKPWAGTVHSHPSRDPRPSAGSADVSDQTNGSVALNGWNNQRTYSSSKRSIVSQGPISCKAVRMGLGRTRLYGSRPWAGTGSGMLWRNMVILEPFESYELDFQCHQFEGNQHPISEVMLVLLKSGQSVSREEAVEEMKDCRSTVHPCCRSTVMPEYGLSIFYDRLTPRSNQKIPKYPWTT